MSAELNKARINCCSSPARLTPASSDYNSSSESDSEELEICPASLGIDFVWMDVLLSHMRNLGFLFLDLDPLYINLSLLYDRARVLTLNKTTLQIPILSQTNL